MQSECKMDGLIYLFIYLFIYFIYFYEVIVAEQNTLKFEFFFLKVLDTIPNAETAQKRIVTTIAGSFLLGGLSTLASFAFNRITADVGTTLTLENYSNENLPIILEDPRYSLVLKWPI